MRISNDVLGRVLVVIIWLLGLSIGGCSDYSGPSDFERQKAAKVSVVSEVAEQGGKAEEKFFSLHGQSGMAWVIDLSGAAISDSLIEEMVTLGYIAEMNLSKSTITDEQLLRLDELKIGRVVMDLNLSDTAITDAALTKLKNFYCLGKLNVTRTKVTPRGVEQFRQNQQSNQLVQAPFRKPQIEL